MNGTRNQVFDVNGKFKFADPYVNFIFEDELLSMLP